ncbi:MAG: hypothetical protein NTV34_07760 [Proteobacteria bacterium]|nr:hypothetical protein [Pseudomonadota bacterium]
MSDWSQDFVQELLAADSPQRFLTAFVSVNSNVGIRVLKYSDLARRSGFSSRAYCRDIVLGNKPITLMSAQKIVTGLKLVGDWRSYFLTLCGHDRPLASRGRRLDPALKLNRLRDALQSKYQLKRSPIAAELNFDITVNRVYAALGAIDVGATLSEIVGRSGLAQDKVQACLQKMEKGNLIQLDSETGRYLNRTSHFSSTQVDDQDKFRMAIEDALSAARSSLRKGISSPKCLYLASSVSVRSERLAEIKTELREILLNFIDQIEDPEGDVILDLLSATWPNQANH